MNRSALRQAPGHRRVSPRARFNAPSEAPSGHATGTVSPMVGTEPRIDGETSLGHFRAILVLSDSPALFEIWAFMAEGNARVGYARFDTDSYRWALRTGIHGEEASIQYSDVSGVAESLMLLKAMDTELSDKISKFATN